MSRVRRPHVKCHTVTLVPAKLIARNFVEGAPADASSNSHRVRRSDRLPFCSDGRRRPNVGKGPSDSFRFHLSGRGRGRPALQFPRLRKQPAGTGYSAGYHQGNLTGTVYIYDDRKQSIPDDPQSPLVKAQLEQSRRDVVGLRRGIGVKFKEDFTIEDARGRTRLICAAFAITDDDGRPRDSFSCLGVAKNKFLKFRISGVSQAEARQFVNAWINLLWPPS